MALGLKGGFALARSGLTTEVAVSLASALALALIVPALGYALLRRFLNGFDAAAIAATYGSVSAVTFITAVQYLDSHGLAHGGHMAAAMALMESPAIVMAVVLANMARRREAPSGGAATAAPLSKVMHEALTDGAQLLLLGAMLVGMLTGAAGESALQPPGPDRHAVAPGILTGAAGESALQPFAVDLFKGMLAFFLLDMGLLAARNMGQLKGKSPWLLAYAIGGPLVHASLALALAIGFGMSPGNGALLMVLAASASYIAVPAVIRQAIPEANPSLYFGMSPGLTFPFNILLGIPLYVFVANRLLA
jgi:uncharacterized protein